MENSEIKRINSDKIIGSIKKAVDRAYKGDLSDIVKFEECLIPDIDTNELYSSLSDFTDRLDCKESAIALREYVYSMSVMICLKKDKQDLIKLIRRVRGADMYPEFKYWIFSQISNLVFHYPTFFKGIDEYIENTLLLKTIVDATASKMSGGLLDYIPAEERDNEFAVVITRQFFSINHGPTKTALDRCCSIINGLHKKVILINTAELGLNMKGLGVIPFYNSRVFNYNPELLNKEYIEWKGVSIPYFQCEDNHLDIPTVEMLLDVIRKYRPGLIVEIGTGSIVASLADRMIPVLSDGLGPSALECSVTTCQTLFRSITEEERKGLMEVGQNENNVIYTVFGSSLKNRTMKVNRQHINLPENAFAIATVGARLDIDLNDEVLDIMEHVSDENTYFVLIGNVEDKSRILCREGLKDHMVFCGNVDDTRAYLEICDIYLNPRRMGGGTSSVESMDVGLPVVTYNYGDVSVNVGEDFTCETFEEMCNLVERYKTDLLFYAEQSIKAKKRADFLQNTEALFCDTIVKFQNKFNINTSLV